MRGAGNIARMEDKRNASAIFFQETWMEESLLETQTFWGE
jgi:hypothetical protein